MANQEQIIEAIKEMSVLELNDLVKAMKKNFVTAAAKVAWCSGGGDAKKRKTEFDVELTSANLQKSKLLKQLKKQLV